jgi:hypothetical protein
MSSSTCPESSRRPPWKSLSPVAYDAGRKMFAWIVNLARMACWICLAGVDGVITDDLGLFIWPASSVRGTLLGHRNH